MADIRYVFVASGQDQVERAFTSIGAAARRHATEVERSYANQVTAARRTSRGVVSEEQRAAKEKERALSYVARIRERHFAEEQRQRDRATSATARQTQREAQDKARAAQYVQRIRDRHFANEQRQTERAAAQKARAEERVAAQKSRLEQRLARERERSMAYVARVRDRHFADEQKRREQDIREAQRAGEQSGRARFRMEQQFRERSRKQQQSTLGKIGGELKGAALGGSVAAGALGLGVGGAAIRDGMAMQAAANRISINARKSGQGFIDPTVLRKEFEAAALSTGGTVKSEEVADAVARFITMTGDIDTARKSAGTFATVASATGANIGDVAEVAASISQQFGVEGIDQFRESLALLTMQGKEGAFELRDAAAQYQRLAASAGSFNIGRGVEAVRTLGGITQIARSGTGSSEQAATAVENLFTNLKVKAEKIEGTHGVEIYKRNKRGDVIGNRALPDIITDLITKVGGSDIDVKNADLAKILGEQGIRSINPLIGAFTTTFQSTKGTEKEKMAAARAEVSRRLSSAINAPGDFGDIEMDAAQAQTGPAAKMAATWERLTASMADRMLPAIERMVDKIEASPEAIDAFVGTFEVMLDFIRYVAETLGMIKVPVGNQKFREKQELERIRRADKTLASLPSDEKVAALMAAGKTEEAKAMQAQLNNPAVSSAIIRANTEKSVASQALAQIQGREGGLAKASSLGAGAKTSGQFEELYASLASTSADPEKMRNQANIVARSLAMTPNHGLYSSDEFLPGENADQRAARQAFSRSQAEQKIQHGGSADAHGAQVAAKGLAAILERISKSAGPAAAALEKVGQAGQPSISSG